jgi:O-antigen/teichoic acid export membrane protein
VELNKEYSKFGRQVGYIVAANIIGLLLGFIQLPILTKGLGANLYGTWSLVNVTISLTTPFALLGLSMAIIRFLAAEKDKSRIREDFLSAFSAVFISGTAFSLFLFFFSDYLAASVFKDINSSIYIKLASVLILLRAMLGLNLAFLRAFRKIGFFTTMGLIQSVFEIGLMALFIFLGYNLMGVITAAIVTGILLNLITLIPILRQIGFQLPRFSHLRAYLKFSIPLTPNSTLAWIIALSDRYIIGYFIGAAAAGIYNAAYSIGNYASFLLIPIGIVLYPTVAKLYDEKKLNETRNYLSYTVKYLMMISIPAAFGLSILAKPLLQILATPEFVPGATVVPFVALGAVISTLYQISEYIILLVKKTWLLTMLLSISAALNIILNVILVPRMGILGAAVATLIVYGILGILTLIVTRRYLKFDISMPFMLKSAFSSAIMLLCIWSIHPESIVSVIISIFAGILIYFGILLLLKGLSREEITFFKNFLKDSLSKIRVIK